MPKYASTMTKVVLALLATGSTPSFAANIALPEKIESSKQIVFCTDVGFPPWEMLNPETQKPEGFDIDIATAVSKALGVESTHKNISFDGLVPALQAGQCDAIISGFYDKPDRRKVVDFANYAVTGTALIVKADSELDIKTLADLSGRKIAVGIGTAGEGLMVEANDALKGENRPEITPVSLPTSSEAFQQLLANLVEGYLGSSDQAAYYNKLNPGSVKLAGPAVNQFLTGIATLPNNKALHEAFEAAIAEIKANGEYDRILKTWSFEDLALR